MSAIHWAIEGVERGLIPDAVTRRGIRALLAERLALEAKRPDPASHRARFLAQLRESPIALHTQQANEQHYELPAEFFRQVLGPHLKYSAGFWPDGVDTLEAAEAAMLDLTCQRAELRDGQRILELGCGWGSLTLWMARHYPHSHVVAVSNAHGQRRFIEARAVDLGLANLEVITADINDFSPPLEAGPYDRVVSVEMFEHLRNYAELLGRISRWLSPAGRLFVHLFSHCHYSYPFEVDGQRDWMSRHFFTGGLMPADDLLPQFDAHLAVEGHWWLDGHHYQHTCEAWLQQLDARQAVVMPLLVDCYGKDQAARWYRRWRLFFMACAELFGYRGGCEWGVSHYRLAPVAQRGQASG